MNILRPSNAEEMIISLLQHGSLPNHELFERVRTGRGGLTKQGFYAALRKLKKAEIVIVYKKTAALNTTWIERMQEFIGVMRHAYIGSDQAQIADLADRESVSYVFLNTRHLDVFWGHAQNMIIHAAPAGAAVFAYDPHYWFYIARKETEQQLVRQIEAAGRQFLMTVGGHSLLDRSIRGDFKTDSRQYHIAAAFSSNTYYVTVIGDYLIEVYLDKAIAQSIDEIYETNPEDTQIQLEALLSERSRSRLRISRNHARAEQIRTRLSKPFYIKS
ncbi:MAG TPA: hypothetical protein VF439_02465 [Candidatus Paceibacterota bacterium]